MEPNAPWDEIARLYRDLSIPFKDLSARFGLTTRELSVEARQRGWPKREELRRKARAPVRKLKAGKTGKAGQRQSKNAKVARPGDAVTDEPAPAAVSPAAAQANTAAAAKPKTAHPRALVRRVYNTIEKELSKLDEHDGASSQDRERASRALSQLLNSLEKAVEMQREISTDDGRKRTTAKDKEAMKHAEDLRREIADRIERIQRARPAAK